MNFECLKYVREYFNYNFSDYSKLLGEKEITTLIFAISKQIWEKYGDIELLNNANVDNMITIVISDYLTKRSENIKKNYDKLSNYVYDSISEIGDVHCSNETLNCLVRSIVIRLIPLYAMKQMDDNKLDDVIKKYYDKYCDIIRTYVINCLSRNVMLLIDVNQEDIVKDILKMIFHSDKMSVEKLFDREYDNIIIKLAERSNRVSKCIKEIDQVFLDKKREDDKHVSSREQQEGSHVVGKKYQENSYAAEVASRLDKINGLNIMENSVITEDVAVSFKSTRKKKNIDRTLATILVASVLTCLTYYAGARMINDIKKSQAMDNLSEIDPYSYPSYIHGMYDHGLEPTANNIMNTYDEYSSFDNSVYTYLAFYRAFDSAISEEKKFVDIEDDDRFFVMDIVMEKIESSNNSMYRQLQQDIDDYKCFLDFVYDRLEEMGFTEIKNDEYRDLLHAYMRAKTSSPYRDPVESLTNSQIKLLNKVSDKYVELSEKHLRDLGEKLGSGYYETVINDETEGATMANSVRRS